MLFAATRLTLVRELGSEHFRETILVTTPEELSPKGFEKHDAHNKLDAPLTKEEQTLGEVRRAEQQAGSGTGVKEIHLSKNFAMPVSEKVIAAMQELGQGGGRTVTMLVSNNDTVPVLSGLTCLLVENQPRNRDRGACSRITNAKHDRGAVTGDLTK